VAQLIFGQIAGRRQISHKQGLCSALVSFSVAAAMQCAVVSRMNLFMAP
jgi:hypothetical protein